METIPRRESWRRRSFQTPRNPLTRGSVGSFGISEGNITGRGKKKKTEYMPNRNSQGRSSPDARICHQQAGTEQGGVGCMLRIKIQPECPEDNLRELTWDSNRNCGIARGREEKTEREREIFPVKSSKLTHSWACSQNKGLSKFQRRAQRRRWHPTPVLLPGISHGRRSLVGCSPWGR